MYQKKARMEDLLGEEWFEKVFLRQCGAEKSQFLILDNHHSHEVTGLLEHAKQEDIHIIPTHTTSELYLLDVACFSLKRAYSSIGLDWMTESPLNYMNKWAWASLFNKAWDQADNTMSGFRATGICPLIPRINHFPDPRPSHWNVCQSGSHECPVCSLHQWYMWFSQGKYHQWFDCIWFWAVTANGRLKPRNQ